MIDTIPIRVDAQSNVLPNVLVSHPGHRTSSDIPEQPRFASSTGFDAAGAVLIETTQVYAKRGLKLAIKVASETG